MITPPHFPLEMRENANPNSSFPSLPFPSLLYSCSPVGPKRLDRFLRLIPQNDRFGARKCLLYDSTLQNEHLGVLTPNNCPKTPLYAEIPAKFNISNYRCNFRPTWPIFMEFEIELEFTNWEQLKSHTRLSIQKTFQFISSINGVNQTYKKAKILFVIWPRITAYRLE